MSAESSEGELLDWEHPTLGAVEHCVEEHFGSSMLGAIDAESNFGTNLPHCNRWQSPRATLAHFCQNSSTAGRMYKCDIHLFGGGTWRGIDHVQPDFHQRIASPGKIVYQESEVMQPFTQFVDKTCDRALRISRFE